MAWDNFHYTIHGRDVHLIPQGDGSKLQWLNCAAASAAMFILSEATGIWPGKGKPWPPTGASFRAATGDTQGGLIASTVDETANRIYGVDPDFQIASTEKVIAKLRAGYGLTYSHSHGPIADAGFEGSAGFRGNHSAFDSGIEGSGSLIKITHCDPLYDGRRREIPTGPQKIPLRAFIRAGEFLSLGNGRMIDRYGPGKLLVGFTRTPYRPTAPVVSIQYSVKFGDGTFYIYQVKNEVIIGRTPHRFSKPTSAPCGAPQLKLWPGNTSQRLVQISAGVLKREYVAVPQGGARLVEKEILA